MTKTERATTDATHALHNKLMDATRGTRLGAIIACALGWEREALPRFTSKAVVTSDGFVQANFVDRNGTMRHSAFVGSMDELKLNLDALGKHLKLDLNEQYQLTQLLNDWIAVDYR